MPRYNENQNLGLPTYLPLENGRFKLVGGTNKAQNNVDMVFAFIGGFRIYRSDFVPDILWLVQRPVSWVATMKTLILGNLVLVFKKYVPMIDVSSINIIYDYKDRKKFAINMNYSYKLEPESEVKTTKFI